MQKKTKRSIVPPGSVLRFVKVPEGADEGCERQIGRLCRVGYYCRKDGTEIVWIVNQFGEYVETWDQSDLEDYFEIVQRSQEEDLYGLDKPQWATIESSEPQWQWT